jgi:hypothetical protein
MNGVQEEFPTTCHPAPREIRLDHLQRTWAPLSTGIPVGLNGTD